MTDPTELRALASAWCDDRLDEADARRLEALLRDDPETQERFLEYMDLHAALCRRLEPLAQPALVGLPLAEPLASEDAGEIRPSGIPWKKWLAAFSALAAAALVGLGLFLSTPPEIAATVVAGEAELTRDGATRPAAPPEPLRVKDRLRTRATAHALVRTADGGRLRLDGNSVLEMTSDRLAATGWKLEAGTLTAVAGERPLRFAATDAGGPLAASGEVFVFVGPEHARVEATVGTVEPLPPDGRGEVNGFPPPGREEGNGFPPPGRGEVNGFPPPGRGEGNGFPPPGRGEGNGFPRLGQGEAAERPPGGAWRRVEPRIPPRVTGFLLVDAVTGQELQPLLDGAVIDLAATGPRIQLQALVAGDVAAVRLNGPDGKRIEHEGQEVPWSPMPGPHVVVALPLDPEGRPGTSATVSFRIVAAPGPP